MKSQARRVEHRRRGPLLAGRVRRSSSLLFAKMPWTCDAALPRCYAGPSRRALEVRVTQLRGLGGQALDESTNGGESGTEHDCDLCSPYPVIRRAGRDTLREPRRGILS